MMKNSKKLKYNYYYVLQGNYGYGWDDEVTYNKHDPEQTKGTKAPGVCSFLLLYAPQKTHPHKRHGNGAKMRESKKAEKVLSMSLERTYKKAFLWLVYGH